MDGLVLMTHIRWKDLRVAGWCLALVCALSWAGLPEGEAQAVEPRGLPGRISTEPVRVVKLSYCEPDGSRVPVVEICSDGLVRVVDLHKTTPRGDLWISSDRLSEEELKELHDLLFHECHLAQLTSAGIEEAIDLASHQRQLSSEIEGSASTQIGLLVGTRWHIVECPAVSILANRFPEITELHQISKAQSRLQNIASVALVGGRDEADRHAVTATQRLLQEHPDAGEMTRRDLTMVRTLPNGGHLMQFRYAGTPGQSDGCLVCVTKSPLGLTRVSLMNSPTVIR